MRELRKDNTAAFHFAQGELDSGPGPGVEGYSEGPYFSYYQWPRTFHDNDQSLLDAYDLLYEIIEEEGPFDGILGFSHGGTLACGFLVHHAKNNPYSPPTALFRCAVFFNSLPPFRMDDKQNPIFEEDLQGYLTIPTVHVVGKSDFVYQYSMKLYALCDSKSASLVVTDRGHDIPVDQKNVDKVANALRDLNRRVTFL